MTERIKRIELAIVLVLFGLLAVAAFFAGERIATQPAKPRHFAEFGINGVFFPTYTDTTTVFVKCGKDGIPEAPNWAEQPVVWVCGNYWKPGDTAAYH